MLLLLSKWPSLRLHLSPPGIHKFSVFPLLQTLHGSLGISTQLLSLACGAPHSGVLTPSLASFPVAVPHVVATWVNQLTLSLQAFACSVSPVQSCIMNTLIFPWASSSYIVVPDYRCLLSLKNMGFMFLFHVLFVVLE